MRRSPGHGVVLALAAAAPLVCAALAVLVTPSPTGHGTHEQLGLPACTPMKYLGIPCPGCGVTTSVAFALHGEFAQALRVQPFGLLVLLGGLVWVPWALVGHVRGRDLGSDATNFVRAPVLITLGALLVVCWIYKLWITLA